MASKRKISWTAFLYDAMSMITYEVLGKNLTLKHCDVQMILCLNHGMYCPVLMSISVLSLLPSWGRGCQMVLGWEDVSCSVTPG